MSEPMNRREPPAALGRVSKWIRDHERAMGEVIEEQARTAAILRAQKATSTDPERLEREAVAALMQIAHERRR